MLEYLLALGCSESAKGEGQGGLIKTEQKLEDGLEEEEREFSRRLAIFSVAFCCCSLVFALVTLPALLSSVQTLHAEVQLETDFCRLRLRDFLTEIGENGEEQWQIRNKRSWLFGHFISDRQNTPKRGSVIHAAPTFTGSATAGGGYGGYGGVPAPIVPSDNGYGGAEAGENGEKKKQSGSTSEGSSEYGGVVSPQVSPSDAYGAVPIANAGSGPASVAKISGSPPAMKPPSAIQQADFCCCCQGAPGEQGEAGDDGENGIDGVPGVPGEIGHDGSILSADFIAKEPCIICPVGPSGPMGPQGPRGPTGPKGANGNSGIDGKRGEPGMDGPPGPIGNSGPVGHQGPSGIPGRQFYSEGPRGPQGKVGPKGPKGLPGCQGPPGNTVQGPKGPPGDAGRPGKDGHKGQQGPNGVSGEKGISGECGHCPPPRTPPGY